MLSKIDSIADKDINQYFKLINKNQFYKDIYYSGILYINFLDSQSNINFKDLSTGEKQLFNFIVNFAYTLIQTNENRVLLLDEVETSLHPQWQKQLLNLIVKYISYMQKTKLLKQNKYHLILTSHSPFLLSDLPKENIIFLDKNENENCKVINGLREKKQTFGANIHTLLSDSFFMEDGLMGEFAKEKIEDIIDYLNDTKSSIEDNDEAQKLINIIGEPIIKNQLQKMLDSKRLTKIDEIDSIKIEISDLEKRLKDIEDAKNKS